MARDGNLSGRLTVKVQEGIQLDQLTRLVKDIVNEHGCPTCGLVGLDLDFTPVVNLKDRFGGLEGVVDATLVRG